MDGAMEGEACEEIGADAPELPPHTHRTTTKTTNTTTIIRLNIQKAPIYKVIQM